MGVSLEVRVSVEVRVRVSVGVDRVFDTGIERVTVVKEKY